ncbi:MAG: 3'-5' exonuclease domain-containing protein 2 [Proteobacteria bacterium]|nr:3'-5' exonuclease domain-containing protein 2 [Pseudomonadota bacterium]MBU1714242.1 3'-5' exonuclease domain-containing protein 2 [Pseudomonadota bacterium]
MNNILAVDFERPGFDRRMTRDEINEMPIRGYNGTIKLVRTEEELERAVEELSMESVLGFDTETRPAYVKGQSYPPALIQLAGAKTVYLIQLKQLKFPGKLRKILENKNIIKAGVSISFDLQQLKELGPFTEAGFVELADLAKEIGIRNHGLRGLSAVLLNFRISKGAQRSNWATEELTNKQIRYAATDAWVGRELYLGFKDMGFVDFRY